MSALTVRPGQYCTGDGVLRCIRIVGILASSDTPLSRREIARRVGVSEGAIRKRVALLTEIAPVEEDDRGHLLVRREAFALWLQRAGWPVDVRPPDPRPHPVPRRARARKVA